MSSSPTVRLGCETLFGITAVRVSLSRASGPHGVLHAAVPDYDRSYETILTGLSPCLPPEAFDMPDRN